MAASLKRRVARAGGWKLAKKLIKPIPIVGTVVVVGLAFMLGKRRGKRQTTTVEIRRV